MPKTKIIGAIAIAPALLRRICGRVVAAIACAVRNIVAPFKLAVIAVVIPVILSGCATWSHPNFSEAKWANDKAACHRETNAHLIEQLATYGDCYDSVCGALYGAGFKVWFNNCLISKGYTKSPGF